jgi:two-component system chemotaxis response regulator CheB
MIRIIIADDSPSTRELLKTLVTSDKNLEVVAMANNGAEAIALTKEHRPDLVLMDIQMPGVDGIQAAREIMKKNPTAIVMISAIDDVRNSQLALDAFEAGVLAVLNKPPGPGSQEYSGAATHIINTIKAIATVKPRAARGEISAETKSRAGMKPTKLVAIASSVGGPAALQTIFSNLPADFAVPIVLVQHIAVGFADSLAKWLQHSSLLKIRIAVDGETLEAATVYIAPDRSHVKVRDNKIILSVEAPVKGFLPSATVLFNSAAEAYGENLTAVILTGMGDDGVEGLKTVKEKGGLILAQDQATSVVFGMNGEAVARGLVDNVLPIEKIAQALIALPKSPVRK